MIKIDEESESYEVWARNPDGTEGRVTFLNSPEVYDDLAVAYHQARKYHESEKGWDVPENERRVWFIVTATTTREVEVTIDA